MNLIERAIAAVQGNMIDTLSPDQLLSNWVMGVDLAQVHDYTAIAIMQHTFGYLDSSGRFPTPKVIKAPPAHHRYAIRHLERLPLNTSYPDQVKIIKKRFLALPKPAFGCQNVLLVDATGVGRPVVDLTRAEGLTPIAITITGFGDSVAGDYGVRVPKRELVARVQVILQGGRLQVAQGLPERDTLIQEMQNFRYRMTQAANLTYNAREGKNDDVVLATALCCWYAYRYANSIPVKYRTRVFR